MLTIALIICASLQAVNVYALDSLDLTPFTAASYYGSYSDALYNPASLPLMREDGNLLVSYLSSDDIDLNNNPGLRLFQNHTDKLVLSFLGRNISLTGQFGSDFRIQDSYLYDVYNTIDAQIDWAYALPHFSFGIRMKGGNSMIRSSKEITNLIDAYANVLFSPFENDVGSARFALSGGVLAYFEYGACGIYIDKIMSLVDGSVSTNIDSVMKSSTISFYTGLGRVNSEGELNLIRPRISISYSSLTFDTLKVDFKSDITLQMLPSVSLALGIGYCESEHKLFSSKSENGRVSFYLKGEYGNFKLLAGCSFKASDFSTAMPSIALTYIK